jgi:hypothetical protein
MAFYPVEITEFAIGDANICGINIPVDLPGDPSMAYLPFPDFVGNKDQFAQRSIFEEKNTFLHAQEIQV